MAILDSLKKLGRKMTGNAVQGTDIESAIDSIANNYSGGGGSILVVRFTWDDGDNIICDKTYSEIQAAAESGLPMVGHSGESFAPIISGADDGHKVGYEFSGVLPFGRIGDKIFAINGYSYTVWSDNSVTYDEFGKEFD